jgi:hypothetical protein
VCWREEQGIEERKKSELDRKKSRVHHVLIKTFKGNIKSLLKMCFIFCVWCCMHIKCLLLCLNRNISLCVLGFPPIYMV